MRRLAILAAPTAALVGVVSGAGAERPKPMEPLLALFQLPNTAVVLARLDPLSLRPVSPRHELGEGHAWSVSPDGSQLALGRGGAQGRGIQIVDLEAMEIVREVDTGIKPEALAWLAPRLLVAVLQRGGTRLVDPVSGRILRRWLGFSFPDASARTREALVMLFPPLRRTAPFVPLTRVPGAPRVAVVDAQRRLRSITLERIQLGVYRPNAPQGVWYADRAGLAVDADRRRAYVFAAGAPVADVDLRTMRVSYHPLAPGNGLPNRKVRARDRDAIWLGSGRVLVFGRDLAPTPSEPFASIAAGATVVDTATWRARVVDATAGGAAFAAGRILTYGTDRAWGGVRSYTLRGRRVFHLFREQQVWHVRAAGETAYVRAPRRVYVLDVRSGKVLNEIVPPVELVDVIVGRS